MGTVPISISASASKQPDAICGGGRLRAVDVFPRSFHGGIYSVPEADLRARSAPY